MNTVDILKHLYNYYTVAAVTGSPIGLFLPLSYEVEHKYYSNMFVYKDAATYLKFTDKALAYNYNAVVGIYDDKDNLVWCNAVTEKPYTNASVYTIGGKKLYQYGWYNSIVRPGTYYSRVMFSGHYCLPTTNEVAFEVTEYIDDEHNYQITIDHGFYKDTTNKTGIWYIEDDISTTIDMSKYK